MAVSKISTHANTNEFVRSLPPETAILQSTLKNLGFWSESLHAGSAGVMAPRTAFPRNLGELAPNELAEQNALWVSELSRVTELLSLVKAQKIFSDTALRRVIARETEKQRAALRAAGEKATAGEIKDKVELAVNVSTARDICDTLESMVLVFEGIREATEGYLQVISREITRRGQEAHMFNRSNRI